MAITETGLLAAAVSLLSGVFAWMFKRQIARIDELERRQNEQNVSRAEMAKDIKQLIAATDKLLAKVDELHDEQLRMKSGATE